MNPSVNYDSKLVSRLLITSIVFLMVGLALGVMARLQISGQLPPNLAFFYKIVTAHPLVLFAGWQSMFIVGMMYYIVPTITGQSLWSNKLANWCFWLLTVGTIGILIGGSQARYTAYFPLKHTIVTMVSLALVLVAVFLNFILILQSIKRYKGHKHPTLYYYAAAVIMGFFTLAMAGITQLIPVFFPNAWLDPLAAKQFIWLGLHTFANQWINVSVLGTLYFLIPLATGRPIFSEKGAIFGLLLYMVFNVVAYFHHLFLDPILNWQKLVGQYFTWLLLVTSTLSIYNLIRTGIGGKWNLAMKFYMVALVSLAIEGLIGVFHGTIIVNTYVHNTQAIVGYVHTVLFMYVSVAGMGMIYQVLPTVLGRSLFSERLGNMHLWVTTIGGYGMIITLLAAGYIQPGMARVVLIYDIVFKPFMIGASLFGSLLFLAQFVFVYNIYKTVKAPKKVVQRESEAVVQA